MNSNQPLKPEQASRVLMIICGSLIMGCLVLTGIMSVIARMKENWMEAGPITWLIVGMGAICLPLSIFLPPILARSMINRAKQDAGPGGRVTDPVVAMRVATNAIVNQYIIRFALLEGVAFFGAIVMLLEGSWIALGVVLFIVALMLALFPWPMRFEESRDDLIRQMNS